MAVQELSCVFVDELPGHPKGIFGIYSGKHVNAARVYVASHVRFIHRRESIQLLLVTMLPANRISCLPDRLIELWGKSFFHLEQETHDRELKSSNWIPAQIP